MKSILDSNYIHVMNYKFKQQILQSEINIMNLIDIKYAELMIQNFSFESPVIGLKDFANYLNKKWDSFTETERRQYTIVVAETVDRIVKHINNLADLNKLQNPLLVNKEPNIDISNIIHDLIGEYAKEINASGNSINIAIKDNIKMSANWYMISKLINLLLEIIVKDNTKSQISVELIATDKAIQLTIASEQRPKLEDSHILSSTELLLMRKIVNLHNGLLFIQQNKQDRSYVTGLLFPLT